MTTSTNPTLAEQLAAAAAASREPTLGELFLRGAGSVQGDIQSFLRQLATSPQAASEAEKERERREKRGLRKRKRQLMAASAAKTAAAAATSPPAQSRKNGSGPSSASSKKAKTTKNESDRPRQAKTAANLASAAPTPVHPRPTTAPAATTTYPPSAPTTHQPWPVRPPPPVPTTTTTRHHSLPLICADAQCDCSGVHDPAAVSTQSLWKSREFEHSPNTNNTYLVPTLASSSSSSFLVDPSISPHLPSASSSSSSSSTLSSPVFSSTTTSTSNSMSLPPVLSWVDSFFSSLGEMADLVEPSSSSGCIAMAPPCATTSTTTSSTLLSYSSAPSLRHLYPAIDDWPSPHYPNHQHQPQHHHHQPDYTPQRSPITDLLYSSTSSSSSLHHAPTWQSESWSSPPAPPPRDQHTTAGCDCCPAPLAVAVGVSSPYPPGWSWLSGGGW
ncbi:uncharacterized protein ACA1_159810 [Acanthamoeba castellanii str. Neff]|uniref:Uncharacterized protein n=1 Tax=Acanthamoeba castellanii (strain ATCC 30010 / Neff) TaxID=1257118 RepID=L8HBP5_ACACF|nr:uncharacterized protein ACA1_159810 [Acanthamoeba castellanii str. Neff]ELR22133.1 hypothetical protein ACA1_159810 [Acanthamoeba castellanii str. Neff]